MRMGRLGQLSAKAALIAYDQPLIVRLLEQTREAGIRLVVITTSPQRYGQLQSLISSYEAMRSEQMRPSVRVLKNHAHRLGPLEALREVLRHTETSRCLMCLGDMYFRDNPFTGMAAKVADTADYLGVAEAVDPHELMQGGLVYCRERGVAAVIERPQRAPSGALRWSGLALFSHQLYEDLDLFLSLGTTGQPVGDLFEFRRKRGRPLYAIDGPDFVNVNSLDHLFLATLYRAMAVYTADKRLYNTLSDAAIHLRNTLNSNAPSVPTQ